MTPIYFGIFFDKNDVVEAAGAVGTNRLARVIETPHITFAFRKEMPAEFEALLGSEVSVPVVGYANDGRNEGLEVTLDPSLLPMYNGASSVHVTVSVANGAKPVDTGKLRFAPVDSDLTLVGRFGYFNNDVFFA